MIEELQAKLRGKEREQDKLRAFRDRETSKERLRQHRIIDKGRDIMNIIQDDTLSSKAHTNQSIIPKGGYNNMSLCTSRSNDGGLNDNYNNPPSIIHKSHVSNKSNMRSQPRQQ
jgi:hypothetical protein